MIFKNIYFVVSTLELTLDLTDDDQKFIEILRDCYQCSEKDTK